MTGPLTHKQMLAKVLQRQDNMYNQSSQWHLPRLQHFHGIHAEQSSSNTGSNKNSMGTARKSKAAATTQQQQQQQHQHRQQLILPQHQTLQQMS
jgi:hypothetical protein